MTREKKIGGRLADQEPSTLAMMLAGARLSMARAEADLRAVAAVFGADPDAAVGRALVRSRTSVVDPCSALVTEREHLLEGGWQQLDPLTLWHPPEVEPPETVRARDAAIARLLARRGLRGLGFGLHSGGPR